MIPQRILALVSFCGTLALGVLACQANAANMRIAGTPSYICPSATPRPTAILPAADGPRYLPAFSVNVDYPFVDPSRSVVLVQYLAQNVGTVRVWATGQTQSGIVWNWGPAVLAVTGNYLGVLGAYPLGIPATVTVATVWVASDLGTQAIGIQRRISVTGGVPLAMPCCRPNPIFPTPRPTYTPYPTPTPFAMQPPQTFFLDDPIYNDAGDVKLRIRFQSPIRTGQLKFFVPLLEAVTWSVTIANVGTAEYDFLGAGYTFVTEIFWNGQQVRGIWPPSHAAAAFLGIVEQGYSPRAILPGQTLQVTVAAWLPSNAEVRRLGLIFDPYRVGDPGWATFVPGTEGANSLVEWQNAVNTICKGEIQYP